MAYYGAIIIIVWPPFWKC